MKILFIILPAIIAFGNCIAQSDKKDSVNLYHPNADANKEINEAVAKAGMENKHVLIQVGGNWCIWCIRFHQKVMQNDTLRDYMETNFVNVKVNYSKENKNEKVLADLEFPQRFGFPVFLILDGKGRRIHTQSSAYLEEGSGHSARKILEFFQQWSPSAIDPKTYERK